MLFIRLPKGSDIPHHVEPYIDFLYIHVILIQMSGKRVFSLLL